MPGATEQAQDTLPGRAALRRWEKTMNRILIAVVGLLAGLPGLALATYTAQDYSSITTSFTAELVAAMPIVLTIFGTVFAIGVAFKLFKKARGA